MSIFDKNLNVMKETNLTINSIIMMLSVLSNEDKICVAEQLLQQAKPKKPKHSADYYAGMWSDENFPPIDEMLDDLKKSRRFKQKEWESYE